MQPARSASDQAALDLADVHVVHRELLGAMGSKHILAVKIDPEANMVKKANWAVIADLHELIPAVTEEVRRRRA